ncbi:MAG: class I SAM-dependent methyltransferase [Polyangiaceae bacterium]|nr:class I SAM-dependent methyltransferase [Polyangiaceae bacterium]
MDARSRALLELGRALRASGYQFITTTPETHRRVWERRGGDTGLAQTLRDVFGWNMWFAPEILPQPFVNLLENAHAVQVKKGRYRSDIRFASLGGQLYAHSSWPTETADSVFFGPDTYRFCSFLGRLVPRCRRLLDVGCGSGAGGLWVAHRTDAVVMCDINERALWFAEVNTALSEPPLSAKVGLVRSNIFDSVHGTFDVIVANPPYLRDPLARQYRDGRGTYGEEIGVRIVKEALTRLEPGGSLLLYTGAPIIEGKDYFLGSVRPLLEERGCTLDYQELDPDVFGEELERAENAPVERFAAVGLYARMPA